MNILHDQESYLENPEPQFQTNPAHNCFPSSSAHRHEAQNNRFMINEERLDRYRYSNPAEYAQMMQQYGHNAGGMQIEDSEEQPGVSKETLSKIKKMLVGKSTKDCSICMNKFERDELIRQLPCKHIFHNKCIKRWLCGSVRCPLCRLDVVKFLERTQN